MARFKHVLKGYLVGKNEVKAVDNESQKEVIHGEVGGSRHEVH